MPTNKRDPNALYCDDKSLTQQAHAGDCDINEIIRRSQSSGMLPVSSMEAKFGDFSNIPTMHEAFEFVRRAGEAFMSLDWKLRERFSNDPSKMIEFISDPTNRDEAVSLGLLNAPPPVTKAPDGPTPITGVSDAK